jgi:hypothetical protein
MEEKLTPFVRLRWWLIVLLAKKDCVVLNVHISPIGMGKDDPGLLVEINGRLLMDTCSFSYGKGIGLQIKEYRS